MPGNLTSALAIKLNRLLPWGHATVSSDLLPAPADLGSPFDHSVYAARDSQLAYRDFIVAAAASKLAMLANDLYGGRFTRIALPATVIGELSTEDTDFGYSTPGSVRQVAPGDAPLSALQTDIDLAARDALIYSLLYNAAAVAFEPNPLGQLAETPADISDVWSLASGQPSYATVSAGRWLDQNLFNLPDFDLADRDNQLAAWAARLVRELYNPLDIATRVALTAAANGQVSEFEFYNLSSDDGRFKVFSGWPNIPSRYRLTYDSLLKTINWTGEAESVTGSPKPVAQSFVTAAGSYVALSRLVPGPPDCEYYRQKSARLIVRPYRDVVSIRVGDVENYAIGGSVYQLDGVVLAQTGSASFSVPAPVQAGCVRVGLLVKPVRTFDVLGFQNTAGISSGTSAPLAGGSSLTWSVPVPLGRYYLSATFSDPTGQTEAYQIRIYYNNTLVFDGSWAYYLPGNASTTTQSFEFPSAGGPAIIKIERIDTVGDLLIEKLSLTSLLPADLPVQYSVAAQIGIYAAPVVILNGILERTESIFFDIATPVAITAPVMTVSFYGLSGVALKVYGFDTRTYEGTQPLPNPESYEGAKATLLARARDAVVAAWSTPAQDYATTDPALGRILDEAAYRAWLGVIAIKQPRLTQAFQIAGPGDVGRPALVPAGLLSSYDGTALLTKPAALGYPTLHVCQPWMVRFGVLVAGPDFWPLPFRACESIAGAFVVSSSFDYTIFDSSAQLPSVANMTSVSAGNNIPNGDNFSAYSLQNTGAGSGYNRQTCTVSVYLNNLKTGTVYSVDLNLRTTPAAGGAAVVSSLPSSVTAESDVGVVVFSNVTAADGYIVEVTGATLS